MSGVPYIGAKISLISKSEIRYEGILYSIDLKESTVALENVKTFGTEGRRKGVGEIPASDNVFDYIIFRGSDIKDLQICEAPQQRPPQPQQPQMFGDPRMQNFAPYAQPGVPPMHPSYGYPPNVPPYMGFQQPYWPQYPVNPMQNPIIPTGKPNEPHVQTTFGSKPSPFTVKPGELPVRNEAHKSINEVKESVTEKPSEVKRIEKEKPTEKEIQTNQDRMLEKQMENLSFSSQDKVPETKGDVEVAKGRDAKAQGSTEKESESHRRHSHRSNRRFNDVSVPKSDYDFERANAKFNKDEVVEVLQDTTEVIFYDRVNSFFDNISCDANTEKGPRSAWSSAERKLNLETFGRTNAFYRGRGHGSGNQGRRQNQRNENSEAQSQNRTNSSENSNRANSDNSGGQKDYNRGGRGRGGNRGRKNVHGDGSFSRDQKYHSNAKTREENKN